MLWVRAYSLALVSTPLAPPLTISVSFCTGAALLVSMLLSSVAGTVIPIVFKKLKIDPAVASGPLITTVNDLVAVVTYYGNGSIMLSHAYLLSFTCGILNCL